MNGKDAGAGISLHKKRSSCVNMRKVHKREDFDAQQDTCS